MALIQICKDDTTPISPNFVANEFYSKSADAPDCHSLDDSLVQAVQFIRTYYNIPICITSTYRTATGNSLIGSSSTSQHRQPTGAVDFQACNKKERDYLVGQLYQQFKDKGEVYQELRTLGINGFGFYDSFVHIDPRTEYSGEVAFWDNTSGKFGDTTLDGKKKNIIRRFLNSIGSEDGFKDYISDFITTLVIVIVIVGVSQTIKNVK